ncbi:hypothetical protein AB6805_13695 [Chitinophaga sp. RCC_12]|uniref:hypothetical protein n=1 Tax=Chitinophaga sp. RCC_12 TaxID=3239226 RepID=UPI003526806E
MKKLLINLGAAAFICMSLLACKKSFQQDSQNRDLNNLSKARALQACVFETLSGNITANRTLSSAIVYKLDGCVTVKSGATLTIPANTLIQGMKTPSAGGKSVLIVERGAKLNINGTATAPVIFTSDQGAGFRLPGDWAGIRIFGQAPNNNANALNLDLGCAIYTGGGTLTADNSGSMQYFQVHFAGGVAGVNDFSQAAIMLNSVGTGTTFDHVQIGSSLNDAMAIFGGLVKLTNVASYNTDRTDFRYEFGYKGNSQFLAAMRLNNTAIPSANAYGIEIRNNRNSSGATLVTQPVISNFTAIGPNYCNSNPVNINYQYAVRIFDQGAGKVFNSVLSSWHGTTTASGFRIESTQSISKTTTNDVEFSYNSFHNAGATPYSNNPGWALACEANMPLWITGSGGLPCDETGNQFSVSTLGYNTSFCSTFCSGFSQNFTLGTTTLASANYSWDIGGQFSHPTYRGAFGATDWLQGWTDWCAQNKVYCN